MDKKLETYLQTVQSELGEMREARREGELREMRQHLEAIIARLTEGGLSEEEATEAAIAQFGEARQVGRELEKVGTRKESLLQIIAAPLGGALCAVVLSLVMSVVDDFVTRLMDPQFTGWWHGSVWVFLLTWPVALASGAVSGLISPRLGGRLLLGLAGLFLVALGLFAGLFSPLGLEMSATSGAFPALPFGLCSGVLLGAHWASRLSQKRVQKQLA